MTPCPPKGGTEQSGVWGLLPIQFKTPISLNCSVTPLGGQGVEPKIFKRKKTYYNG